MVQPPSGTVTRTAASTVDTAATVASGSVSERIDALFAAWDTPDGPGCSLGISRDGAVVYERGYGLSNLELRTPVTPASVFFVASVSKQFTAMSIVLLAQRGQLSFDDEVRRHLTELPDYGTPLTIRHLLTHTSGLRDVFLLRELAAPRDDGPELNDSLVALLARQRGLNFTPGYDYQYNNGGYVLLAAIVQRLSGLSLRAFTQQHIFEPLGMKDTHLHDDPTMLVPHRASGYAITLNGWRQALVGFSAASVGNSGLFTTTRDLLRWEQNFVDVRVGDPALVAAMQRPTRLAGGDRSLYGFGLEMGVYRGLRFVEHGGGDPGYGAHVVLYPDQRVAIAVLCNRDDINTGALARRVADVYLDAAFTEPLSEEAASGAPAATAATALPEEELSGKVGLYRHASSEGVVRIVARAGQLYLTDGGRSGGHALRPVAPAAVTTNGGATMHGATRRDQAADAAERLSTSSTESRFALPGTQMAFAFVPAKGSSEGAAAALHVHGRGAEPEILRRVEPFAPSRRELRRFVGDYRSTEVGVTLSLSLRDDVLVLQIPGRPPRDLEPTYADAFNAPGLADTLAFTRDAYQTSDPRGQRDTHVAHGAITGFTLHSGGIRRLRFDRVRRRESLTRRAQAAESRP